MTREEITKHNVIVDCKSRRKPWVCMYGCQNKNLMCVRAGTRADFDLGVRNTAYRSLRLSK